MIIVKKKVMSRKIRSLGKKIKLGKKLSRFCFCGRELYPYIKKVLLRLPEEVCYGEVLDDLDLEIISFGEYARGAFYPLPNTAKKLVILNESILGLPEFEIIHTIAHEIAHKVIGKGKTGLLEKEAEKLLIAWGFKKESEAVYYNAPILESMGYEMGYEWAKKQKDLSEIEKFYDKWNRGLLRSEGWNAIANIVHPSDVIGILVTEGEISAPPKPGEKYVAFDEMLLYVAFIAGIMGFLRNKRKKKK